MKQEKRIVVRGGGDLATGTIHRLWSAGLRVLVLEAEHPAAIRRQVSLCEAVYEGETTVEGLRAVRVASLAEADAVLGQYLRGQLLVEAERDRLGIGSDAAGGALGVRPAGQRSKISA